MIFASILFRVRLARQTLFLTILAAGFAGCGATRDSSIVRSADEPSERTLDYEAWCDTWQLSCPSADGVELPPITEADVFEYIHGLKDSQYDLELEKELLFHPATRGLAAGVGLAQPFDKLVTSLEQSGFERLGAVAGQATMITAEPLTYTGNSGIAWVVSPEATIDLADIRDGVIAMSGVAAGSLEEIGHLEKVVVGEGFQATLHFADLTVTGVPPAFFLMEAGLKLPTGDVLDFPQIMGNMGHPASLLLRDNRIALDADELDIVANALKNSSSNPSVQSMAMIIEAGLEFTLGGSVPLAFRFARKDAVQCRLVTSSAPDMELTLANTVEISELSVDKESVTTIRFSGIETRILIPGPIKPRLELKQVELSKTHLTIHGIPIIGKLSVPYSNMKSGGFNLQCF